MSAHKHERTQLEARRVRAAKSTSLLLLLAVTGLALWHCVEQHQSETSVFSHLSTIIAGSDGSELLMSYESSGLEQTQSTKTDPLGVEQEGVVFKEVSEDGGIIWYQSSWTIEQSRVLMERALVLGGWQLLSSETDQVMTFVYEPSALSGGGSLLASFHETQEGCSILVELL